MPPTTADDSRSQLLAELSAALCERTAVDAALEAWAAALRRRFPVPVDVELHLTRADRSVVRVRAADGRPDAVAAAAQPGAGAPRPGRAWWVDLVGDVPGSTPVHAPAGYPSGAVLGGPVVGGGALVVMALSRSSVDWSTGLGVVLRGLVDDLRAVLGLAVGLEQAVLSVQDVDAMLRSRAVIDQAVGVLMAHHGCAAEQAMLRLRRASQRSGVPVARLAAQLVTDVSGSAPVASARFRARRAASA